MSQVSGAKTEMPPDKPANTESFSNLAETSTDHSFSIIHQRQVQDAIAAKNAYAGLYTESHAAKVWKVAKECLATQVGSTSHKLVGEPGM